MAVLKWKLSARMVRTLRGELGTESVKNKSSEREATVDHAQKYAQLQVAEGARFCAAYPEYVQWVAMRGVR